MKFRDCAKKSSQLPEPVEFLERECSLDRRGAEQAVEYVRAGNVRWVSCRAKTTVVAERFFDEGGGMQLVIHAPFGSRINRAWGLALRKRFCRTFNFELQAAATDNGLLLSLSDQHSFPLEAVFSFLRPHTRGACADAGHARCSHVRRALEMERRRGLWRYRDSRAEARFHRPFSGCAPTICSPPFFPDQVACAENLTGEIRIPDHPLVNETIDNCLHEAMDLDGLNEILERMEEGTFGPSPSTRRSRRLSAMKF